jgi:ElaB/YqjD/DUF883 family membrane-anchored ribosome-binding protein
MSTELSTAEELKPKLEQQRAEVARLAAECKRFEQLNERLTRTNNELRRQNAQVALQVRTLMVERDAAYAYIHQTRHAPLWGIAIGAGAALMFGGARRP